MTEMSFIDKLCSPTRPSLHQAPLFFFFPFQEKRSAFHSSSIFDRFPRFRKPAGRDVSLYLNGGGGLSEGVEKAGEGCSSGVSCLPWQRSLGNPSKEWTFRGTRFREISRRKVSPMKSLTIPRLPRGFSLFFWNSPSAEKRIFFVEIFTSNTCCPVAR